MPTSEHVLRFPGTLAGFQEAAGVLRGLLDTRRLHGDARYNVELAFEEIATNIIRHGSPTGDVELAIAFDDDETVLTFEDDGVPFDPCEQPDPAMPASIDEALVGGLGLVLVRKVSTRIAYERTPQCRNHLRLAISAR
jgi:anti-sigma regulatory factor (Ser/Thr protein kinase)